MKLTWIEAWQTCLAAPTLTQSDSLRQPTICSLHYSTSSESVLAPGETDVSCSNRTWRQWEQNFILILFFKEFLEMQLKLHLIYWQLKRCMSSSAWMGNPVNEIIPKMLLTASYSSSFSLEPIKEGWWNVTGWLLLEQTCIQQSSHYWLMYTQTERSNRQHQSRFCLVCCVHCGVTDLSHSTELDNTSYSYSWLFDDLMVRNFLSFIFSELLVS